MYCVVSPHQPRYKKQFLKLNGSSNRGSPTSSGHSSSGEAIPLGSLPNSSLRRKRFFLLASSSRAWEALRVFLRLESTLDFMSQGFSEKLMVLSQHSNLKGGRTTSPESSQYIWRKTLFTYRGRNGIGCFTSYSACRPLLFRRPQRNYPTLPHLTLESSCVGWCDRFYLRDFWKACLGG